MTFKQLCCRVTQSIRVERVSRGTAAAAADCFVESLRWLSVEIKEQQRGLFVSLMSLILLLKQTQFGKNVLSI